MRKTERYVTNVLNNTNYRQPARDNWLARITAMMVIALLGMALSPLPMNAQVQPIAYVNNIFSHTISVVETENNTVLETIPSGGFFPWNIATTPDNAFIYTVNSGSDNVAVLSTASNTIVANIPVRRQPLWIDITPDGAFAYVSNSRANNISVINTATNTVVSEVPVGIFPFGLSFTPDGAFAYVANNSSNSVSVISTVTHTVVRTIPVGYRPIGVAITPDGAFAYIANEFSNTVSVISTATNTVVATIFVGSRPLGIAITPDGAFAYISNSGSGTVSVVNTSNNTVVTTKFVGSNPHDLAVTPDGAYVYATVRNWNVVAVINTASNLVERYIYVGSNPIALTFTVQPDLWVITPQINSLINNPSTPPAAISDLNNALSNLQDAFSNINGNDIYPSFRGMEDGIEDLQEAGDEGANTASIISEIYDYARELAADAASDAQTFAGSPLVDDYIADGEVFQAEAVIELAAGHPDQAVRRQGSAYREYQRAIQLGSAIAQGMDAESDVNEIIDDVQNVIDTGGYGNNANAELQDAIDELNDAISDFNAGEIYDGFSDLQDAVEQLQDAENDGAVATNEIDAIVGLAQTLAETKLTEAQAYAGNPETDSRIAQAEIDIADAEAEIASGDHDVAVKEYRDAWYDARIALEHGRGLRKGDGVEDATMPTQFVLEQNYPNPFNPSTTIRFSLPEAANVTLQIYNMQGQLVNTLVSENLGAGYHNVVWNGHNMNGVSAASGLYFYKITAGNFQQAKKMILMK